MNPHAAWAIYRTDAEIYARRLLFDSGRETEVKETETIRGGRGPLETQLLRVRKAIKRRDPDAVKVNHWKRNDPNIIEVWI